MKHIHILGICGTFMGSLAQLAKSLGYKVTGSDTNVYPPMSTQLEAAGIELFQGFDPAQLDVNPDLVVVGNVISRGNPALEAVLNRGLAYTSGPQWLAENVLKDKWVLAVAGTHGKTSTSSMLAWILEFAGMSPGYLIGGVPENFSSSARLGSSDFFVIEADEYDTAFFDKRSKFIHYRPRTVVLNNLEFDHADIFPDLAAIQKQFHHLVRIIPNNGLILSPVNNDALDQVLNMGCWTEVQRLLVGSKQQGWGYQKYAGDGHHFELRFNGENVGEIHWSLIGEHNIHNALSAVAAARHVGVPPNIACSALENFRGVKRRMEFIGEVEGIRMYDDFAHHPSEIKTTLEGLRAKVGNDRLIAIIEPRSNTMKQGVYREVLADAVSSADYSLWYQPPGLEWSLDECLNSGLEKNSQAVSKTNEVCLSVEDLLVKAKTLCKANTHIVIMSNGGFDGMHQRLRQYLGSAKNL